MLSLQAVLLWQVLAQLDVSKLDAEPLTAFQAVVDAITNRNWWAVAGIAVWALVFVTRKYGAKLPLIGAWMAEKVLAKSWSGPLLAVLYSLAGGVLTTWGAGQPFSLATLMAMLGAAAAAVFTQESQQKLREGLSQGLAATMNRVK